MATTTTRTVRVRPTLQVRCNRPEVSGRYVPDDPPRIDVADGSGTAETDLNTPWCPAVAEDQTTLLTTRCSDAFLRVMRDIQTKRLLREQQAAATAARFDEAREQQLLAIAEDTVPDSIPSDSVAARNDDDANDADDDDGTTSTPSDDADDVKVLAAQRAWCRVRSYVRELALGRRSKQSTLQWRLVRHTLAALTHMERARQELYERYLAGPDNWKDGLVNCPDRLQAAHHSIEQEEIEGKVTTRVPAKTVTGISSPVKHASISTNGRHKYATKNAGKN